MGSRDGEMSPSQWEEKKRAVIGQAKGYSVLCSTDGSWLGWVWETKNHFQSVGACVLGHLEQQGGVGTLGSQSCWHLKVRSGCSAVSRGDDDSDDNKSFLLYSYYVLKKKKKKKSVPGPCCCSVAKLSPTLCNPMDYSTQGFPVLHHSPEFAQIHVH